MRIGLPMSSASLLCALDVLIATYLLWVEVYELSWDMLSQCKAMETFGNGCLNDFFKVVLRMPAKLPGMAMM